MYQMVFKKIYRLLLAAVLALCGCGPKSSNSIVDDEEPTIVEEIAVIGFEQNNEPVIKKWSDGSLWIHFEAMPPFFAEDEGSVGEFDQFELTIQDALGLPVLRDDREVFIIEKPNEDTEEKAKAWLESYRKSGG